MEEYSLIKYKWECGIYSLQQMVQLVQKKEITEKDFFNITRYVYHTFKR